MSLIRLRAIPMLDRPVIAEQDDLELATPLL